MPWAETASASPLVFISKSPPYYFSLSSKLEWGLKVIRNPSSMDEGNSRLGDAKALIDSFTQSEGLGTLRNTVVMRVHRHSS